MVHLYAVIPSLSYNIIFFLYDYINANFYSEIVVSDSLEFAASMIVLGFAIKLGAAPFHA
jgi:NADH:ubiquinone oxidoreductase subunit 2 (subunit N)